MRTALFRLGAIVATPDFLNVIPRPVMVQAIKRHATEDRPVCDGQPILSDYEYDRWGFYLLTDADRLHTAIRLAGEGLRIATPARSSGRCLHHIPAAHPDDAIEA